MNSKKKERVLKHKIFVEHSWVLICKPKIIHLTVPLHIVVRIQNIIRDARNSPRHAVHKIDGFDATQRFLGNHLFNGLSDRLI
jgi:hypothetical protein